MELLLDELLGILASQAVLYRSLLSVLKEESEAIIASGLETLKRVNSEKEALASKIQNLEDQRSKVLDGLSDFFGSRADGFSLTKLSEFCAEPFSSRLKACRSTLLSLTGKIGDANNNNRFMLTHAIDIVKGSIGLLNNLITSDSVYYHNGKIQKCGKNGRIFSGQI